MCQLKMDVSVTRDNGFLGVFICIRKTQHQLMGSSRAILNNFILKFNKLLLEMLWYQYNKNILVFTPTESCQVTGKVESSFSQLFCNIYIYFTNNGYCLLTWLNMDITVIFFGSKRKRNTVSRRESGKHFVVSSPAYAYVDGTPLR